MRRLPISIFLLLILSVYSYSHDTKVIDLTSLKWEYRWGDSPFKNGIPSWIIQKNSSSKWKTIGYPSNPPNRGSNTNIWYRVKLPDTLTKDPHVYVFSMDIIPEIYINGKRIYHFGKLDSEGKGSYAGWPWHMFSLPKDSVGQYLYFRLYSNYMDIGLFGEVLISSKGEILERMLDYDIPKMMIGSISIFVAIICIISFLSKFKRMELLILGLLFLTQGLNVFCSVKVIDIYFFHPLLKQYILAVSFFFFPVGMAMFLDKMVINKIPYNPIRRIWQIHLTYIIGAVVGSLFGFFDIPAAYTYFDKLYYFVSLPILTLFIIYFFFKGNNEVKLITSSFMIIALYWIYSFLVAYHLVPWTEYPSDAAVFICLIILSYSIVKKLNYTNELEVENEHLSVLSSTDYLTKLYNRKEVDAIMQNCESIFKRYKDVFSIILLDIDDFKKINDTYGHLVGDSFLIELGELLTSFTREADFVGRWGGEEFLIICPKTKKSEVLIVAEHLRDKIEKHSFDTIGNKTASFGVTTYRENDSLTQLISRADEAMYHSKSEGKNKVNFK